MRLAPNRLRPALLLGMLLTLLLAGAADARSRAHEDRHDEKAAGVFDYYLVSLSWSPSFCATHPDEREQCGGRGFGFVLHGIWPQYLSGYGPQHCGGGAHPDSAVIEHTLAFMPSRYLIEHEWDTHGSCSGLSPTDYFALADRAFASVRIPPALSAGGSPPPLSARDVADAFIAANPGLASNMFAVTCNRNELSEVRICVDRQLQPQVCGKGISSQCPEGNLRIPLIRGGH